MGEFGDVDANKFLRDQSERVAGHFPGLSGLIEELRYRRYGRGITINDSVGSSKVLIGYILPIEPSKARHLLVFNSGDVLVVEPNLDRHPDNQKEMQLNLYRNDFNPSDDDMFLSGVSSMAEGIRDFGNYKSKILFRNSDPNQQTQVQEAILKAVLYAKELKEKREQSRHETANLFMEQINGLLKENDTP